MGGRADILGVCIDRVSRVQTEERLSHFVASGIPHQIVTVNMDFIRHSLADPRFKNLINSSSLSVADGMPILWISRLLGNPIHERITGLDLVNTSCRIARDRGLGVFLLGAEPGIAAQASRVLHKTYPGLTIAGTYSPPFGEFSNGENKKIVDLIAHSRARFLFVALGSPKQDFWIRRHMVDLGVPVCIGVGGVFNYLAGRVRLAPAYVQQAGFEWLFRMAQQPRLARRYLIDDLPVFLKAMTSAFLSSGTVSSIYPKNPNDLLPDSISLEQISLGKG